MSRPRARLAVAGLGRIGHLHADNLAKRVGSAELVAVVDALGPRASEVGNQYGVAWTTSYDDLLADPDVDGVVISTPTTLHSKMIERAAGAGKHVLCEKPLAFSVNESVQAVSAAQAEGIQLQVGFQRRFDPDWLAMSHTLDSGALGELDLVRSSHRNPREPEAVDALGDIFIDVAIHDLDAARWLGGEVVEVFAHARGRPDSTVRAASIALRFASGALGLIDISRNVGYGFECSAELVGAKATARTGYTHRAREVELMRDGRVAAPLAKDHAERHAEAYRLELEHFGEVVLSRASPRSTGNDGTAALRLAIAAGSSAVSGAPVRVVDPPDDLDPSAVTAGVLR